MTGGIGVDDGPGGSDDYAQLFLTSPVLLLVADRAGRILAANPAWEQLLGHPQDQLLGRAFGDLLHPDDLPTTRAAIAGAAAGTPTRLATRVRRSDGEYRNLEWQATVVDQRVYATAVDVTEREQAQSQLRVSQERHRRLFDVTAQAVVYLDPTGRVIDANPAAERIFATSRADLLGLDFADPGRPCVHEDGSDFLASEQPVAVALRTGQEVRDVVLGVTDPTGRPHWLRIRAVPELDASSGAVRAACVTFDDITEARELHTQLAQQNESLRRAIAEQGESQAQVENMMAAVNRHAIVSVTDLRGRITAFNDNFMQISGYSAEELLGQTHRVINSGHHPKEFWQEMWRTIGAGHTWQAEVCNRAKDGQLYWVLSTIQPFRDQNGRVFQYVSIRTEITRQKLAEQEAAAANRAKSRFLATMSHEIRTPLTAIIGLSHLADQSGLDPQIAATLTQIRASGEHLLAMLNDVLDFSKIEVHELELRSDPLDPGDVAAQAVAMHRSLALSKGLALELNVGPEVPQAVVGDEVRLRQVLLNLVSNAVKCTDSGSVRVALNATRIGADDSGQVNLEFAVVDTGRGISAADQQRIFDPFVQADNEYTRTVGGTGLGLAISSHLVSMMGGELMLSSQLGRGSRFGFTIPAKVTSPDLVTHRKAEAAPPTKLAGRVLLVEDNLVNRTIAAQMLARAGLEVDTASDGAQAVAYFASGTPRADVVLMDIHMPILDGWEATRQIRSLAIGKRIPIIALTANALSGDREACLAAGMNDHLAKPFDPAGLTETLARWLPGPGRSASSAKLVQAEVGPDWQPPLDRLAGLRSVGDDTELYCELLDLFATDTPDRLDILRVALAGGDQSEIRATAHFLKGSALALGANQLAAAAAALEKRGTAGTADAAAGEAVLRAAEAVLAAVPELIADLSGAGAAAATHNELVLEELQRCLTASEWVPPDLLARVRAELARRDVPPALSAALVSAVESYDFSAALATLAAIHDLYDAGGGI